VGARKEATDHLCVTHFPVPSQAPVSLRVHDGKVRGPGVRENTLELVFDCDVGGKRDHSSAAYL